MVLKNLLQRNAWLLLVLSLMIVSCTSDQSLPTVTDAVVSTPGLYLYSTNTPTPKPEVVIDLTPVPMTPAPTATPFTHQVEKDETMLGIAFRYGIKLEDLLTANPTVNPRMMSVGTVLIIPLPIEAGEPTPTITPLPLSIGTPACYSTTDQKFTCLVEVRNTLPMAVENLSVWLGVLVKDQLIASQVIYPALDRLPGGERITLQANFTGSFSKDQELSTRVLTAVPVAEQDARYLQIDYSQQQVELTSNGLQAHLTGQVTWKMLQTPPGMIYLFATVYDASGNPVGVRKLETRPTCPSIESPTPCTSLEVEMVVYSLGPKIESIKVLVEARP
jgi:LysM repeat protein